jgi:hypothetical protein
MVRGFLVQAAPLFPSFRLKHSSILPLQALLHPSLLLSKSRNLTNLRRVLLRLLSVLAADDGAVTVESDLLVRLRNDSGDAGTLLGGDVAVDVVVGGDCAREEGLEREEGRGRGKGRGRTEGESVLGKVEARAVVDREHGPGSSSRSGLLVTCGKEGKSKLAEERRKKGGRVEGRKAKSDEP